MQQKSHVIRDSIKEGINPKSIFFIINSIVLKFNTQVCFVLFPFCILLSVF